MTVEKAEYIAQILDKMSKLKEQREDVSSGFTMYLGGFCEYRVSSDDDICKAVLEVMDSRIKILEDELERL